MTDGYFWLNCNYEESLYIPGTGKIRMAEVNKNAWTHPQDDHSRTADWYMAELHDSRPRPVVGLLVKIVLGEHHHSLSLIMRRIAHVLYFRHILWVRAFIKWIF